MNESPSQAIVASPTAQPIHIRTAHDDLIHRLNVGQLSALAALTTGSTVVAAADAAGVTRETVTRWLRLDPLFRAAYNAWRQEVIESTRARLLKIAESATAAVDKAVEKGDARIAMALLTKLGLVAPATAGPVDPALLTETIAIERDTEEHEVVCAERGIRSTDSERERLRARLQRRQQNQL